MDILENKTIKEQIMENANFLFICKYNGTADLKDCIEEAIFNVTQLTREQFCNIFKVSTVDYSKYIKELKLIMGGEKIE